jgi:hypothetical protein
MIRRGDVSSREVIDAHLSRIEQVNPALNAVVRVLADEARAQADAADRAQRDGAPLGVLHGVPITVKENIDLAGTPTTSGVPFFADSIADTDAPVVHRMRAAVFRQSQFSFRILCAEIFVPKSIHFRGFGLLGGDCPAKLPQRTRVQFLAVVTGVGAHNIR